MMFRSRTGLVLLGALVVAACGSDDSGGGSVVTTPGSLTTLSEIEPGDACEAGGTLIETGVDANENGALDADEVSERMNVCAGTDGSGSDGAAGSDGPDGAEGDAGADGVMTLSLVSAASALACPAGGNVVAFGGDTDGSGTLEAGEITSTSTVCNGAAGADSCSPIIKVTPVSAGSVCSHGGVLVAYGQDNGNVVPTPAPVPAAGGAGGMGGMVGIGGAPPVAMSCDGVLDADEVLTTSPVCNGATGDKGDQGPQGTPGSTGSAGASMAIKLTVLPVGNPVNCTARGGLQLESGVDDFNGSPDGILQPSEVDDTEYSCF